MKIRKEVEEEAFEILEIETEMTEKKTEEEEEVVDGKTE